MQFLLRLPFAEHTQVVQPVFKEYEAEFAVSKNVNSDKQVEFAEFVKQKRAFVADICGAVASSLFKAGFTQADHFVRAQLECCRNTVASLGFDEIENQGLIDALFASKHVVVLVPGCQDQRMIRRRVERLCEFAAAYNKAFSVVFSGRNPGGATVTIKNEAEHMRARYDEIINQYLKRKLDIAIHKMDSEDASKNTVENIDKFLESPIFLNHEIKQAVVVISSSFHLIRIGKKIMECVRDNSRGLDKFIDQIVMIGAENAGSIELPHTHWEDTYVKLMMFDLFNNHIH